MVKSLNKKQMIMNFSTPPSVADLESLSQDILDNFPDELLEYIEDLEVLVEEFPDAGLLDDLGLEDEFDLPIFYHGGDQGKENIVVKSTTNEDTLTLFRRPILDMWCDTEEDLVVLLRHLMITDIAENHGYNEEDIKTMIDDFDVEMLATA